MLVYNDENSKVKIDISKLTTKNCRRKGKLKKGKNRICEFTFNWELEKWIIVMVIIY